VQALYAPVAAAAPNGFDIADFVVENCEVWPENWPAVLLFTEMSGQWRTSMSGPVALDYTAIFMRMSMMDLSNQERELLFQDVRIMETEALKQMKNDG
jgi:hypothetical protein